MHEQLVYGWAPRSATRDEGFQVVAMTERLRRSPALVEACKAWCTYASDPVAAPDAVSFGWVDLGGTTRVAFRRSPSIRPGRGRVHTAHLVVAPRRRLPVASIAGAFDDPVWVTDSQLLEAGDRLEPTALAGGLTRTCPAPAERPEVVAAFLAVLLKAAARGRRVGIVGSWQQAAGLTAAAIAVLPDEACEVLTASSWEGDPERSPLSIVGSHAMPALGTTRAWFAHPGDAAPRPAEGVSGRLARALVEGSNAEQVAAAAACASADGTFSFAVFLAAYAVLAAVGDRRWPSGKQLRPVLGEPRAAGLLLADAEARRALAEVRIDEGPEVAPTLEAMLPRLDGRLVEAFAADLGSCVGARLDATPSDAVEELVTWIEQRISPTLLVPFLHALAPHLEARPAVAPTLGLRTVARLLEVEGEAGLSPGLLRAACQRGAAFAPSLVGLEAIAQPVRRRIAVERLGRGEPTRSVVLAVVRAEPGLLLGVLADLERAGRLGTLVASIAPELPRPERARLLQGAAEVTGDADERLRLAVEAAEVLGPDDGLRYLTDLDRRTALVASCTEPAVEAVATRGCRLVAASLEAQAHGRAVGVGAPARAFVRALGARSARAQPLHAVLEVADVLRSPIGALPARGRVAEMVATVEPSQRPGAVVLLVDRAVGHGHPAVLDELGPSLAALPPRFALELLVSSAQRGSAGTVPLALRGACLVLAGDDCPYVTLARGVRLPAHLQEQLVRQALRLSPRQREGLSGAALGCGLHVRSWLKGLIGDLRPTGALA